MIEHELYGGREVEGWTNYATWNIPLHIKNDQGLYNQWADMLRERDEITPGVAFEIASDLFPGGHTPDGVCIGHPGVNWNEIAESWTDDKTELAENE